ncbi:MAG TPA: O-antigen ligase family protein, partial [Kofleriaceae bacterium]|nr:O-antigen ligase family protein [Kofleriaceae bacterium]
APSGTAGNRNFMAHAVVLGLPLLAYLAIAARRRMIGVLWAGAFAIAIAALVLSRCRAAWLAAAAMLPAAGVLYALAPRELRSQLSRARMTLLTAILVAAVGAAIFLPNRLSWGANGAAYADTISRLGDYRSGTGRGRVIQYRNTIRMAADNPLLGVGPGNWSIEYPRYATPGDPSYRRGSLQPVNRLPNTDWLGMLSERGAIALASLLLAFALMGARSLRALRRAGDGRAAVVLLTLLGLAITGSLDAVLIRPEPSLLLFAILGAAVPLGRTFEWPIAARVRRTGISLALVATMLLGFRAAELIRFSHIGATNPTNQATLRRALEADPGSYAVLAMLATWRVRAGDCRRAIGYGRRALALHPNLEYVRRALIPCTRLTASR